MSYVMCQEPDFNLEECSPAEPGDMTIALNNTELANRAQNKAKNYLEEKKVFPLLSFMAGHLLTQEPEDPVSFLLDLTRRLMDFRDMGTSAPMLFTQAHLESLCISLSGPHGGLTDQQFQRGMSTLAIREYKLPEHRNEHGLIDHTEFISAAQEALKAVLKDMLKTKRKAVL